MRPPNSLQNKAQSVPVGNGPAPLLLSCRLVTLPSSLCLQHFNRVPASRPLHLPPLQSEYSSSSSLRSTLPMFKKKKQKSFSPHAPPLQGCGMGVGGFYGFCVCKACDPVLEALGSASRMPLGTQILLFSDFSAGAEAVLQIRHRCHENCASLSRPPRLPPPQLARPRAPPPPSLPPSRRLLPQRSPRPLHRGPFPLLSTWHSLKLSSCSPEACAPQAVAVCPDWLHRVSIQQALNECL